MIAATGPRLEGDAARAAHGASFEPIISGARSTIWRARFGDDRADLAVKMAAGEPNDGSAHRLEACALIHAEAERLIWLAEHLGGRGLKAPDVVVAPHAQDPNPALITTWLEGTTDPRLMRSPEIAVESFARALASLHEASRRIDLTSCPFDSSLETHLQAAARRVEMGLVDTSVLDDPYDRYRPEELVDRARSMAAAARDPEPGDVVLVHGDLCVTNIIFDPAYSSTVGAVDWSHAGVGDRTLDLAVTARSLARNLSGEVLPDFFAAYGLSEPDLLRIEIYTLLEELF